MRTFARSTLLFAALLLIAAPAMAWSTNQYIQNERLRQQERQQRQYEQQRQHDDRMRQIQYEQDRQDQIRNERELNRQLDLMNRGRNPW